MVIYINKIKISLKSECRGAEMTGVNCHRVIAQLL